MALTAAAKPRDSRHPASVAVLAGLLAFTTPVFACAPPEFPGQLLKEIPVEVTPDAPLLVLVNNRGTDLKVQVEGPSPFWSNAPAGRNSPDILILTAQGRTTQQLCLFKTYDHGAAAEPGLQTFELTAADAGRLQPFNAAGIAILQGGNQGFANAARSYALAASSLPTSLPGYDTLALYSRLYTAMSHVRLREYDKAIDILRAMDAAPFNGNAHYYQVLWQLGRAQLRQGKTPMAIETLKQALLHLDRQAATTALDQDKADITNLLGEAAITTNQLTEAASLLAQARELAAGDFELLGRIHNNLGFLDIKRGENETLNRSEKLRYWDASTDSHLLAEYFATEARDNATLQVVENNLAVHYARLGERRKSLTHFLNVLKLFERNRNPEAEAFLYSNLSNYSEILGDYNKAVVYLQKSIALSSAPESAIHANSICRIGTLYRKLDKPDAASAEHRRCLARAEQANDAVSILDAYLQLSIDALQAGDVAAATASVNLAIALSPAIKDNNQLQRLWTQQARLLSMANNLPEAKAAITRALALVRSDTYANDSIEARTVAMEIMARQGEIPAAIAEGEALIKDIESMHSHLEPESLGPAWSNLSDAAFKRYAGVFLDRYNRAAGSSDLASFLDIAERARDISLRQQLAAGLSNNSTSLEEQRMTDVFSKLSRILANTSSRASAPQPAQLDYYHQHDLIALARLHQKESLPIPATFALGALQKRLKPTQQVLYYAVVDAKLQLLVITSSEARLVRSVPLATVQTLLGQLDTVIRSPTGAYLASVQALSALLLPPSFASDKNELLVVTDSGLHTTPFAALAMPGSRAYTPLVSRFTIKQLPSLSAYFMDKPARSHDSGPMVAILANPAFSTLQLSSLDSTSGATGTLRGWADSLQPLPYTAVEAQQIEALFPAQTLAYTGTSANRRNLASAAVRNARVLHLATHGYFKSTSEDNIGLALSSRDENGNADPGFITLTELFGSAFNNDLVVISGCDTAMGREQAGVGMNSLTRGFLAQGVKHVISTLWPVSDRASAEFMRIFYRNLKASGQVSLALQQAQQEFRRNPLYRNPYYWSAYVLTTDSPEDRIAFTP